MDHRALADVAAMLRAASAAEIMPRFRNLGADAIRQKSSALDLVTDADEAAERQITTALQARFPGCLVVGEEATAADPGLPGRMAGAALAFTVDPVDGTANFAAGLPLFGVMVAAVVQGEVAAAWVLDPMSGDMAMALRGEGAFAESMTGARTALRVAAPVPMAAMLGAISWGYMAPERRARVLPALAALAGVQNLRCAAHEWRMAAAGHLHLLAYNRLLPWDHAPGWLLHREAGGYAARFDGSAYTPLESSGGLLAAPDRATWDDAMAALRING
ncbi:MAG: inositol monophosphatase [Rubritepida sp.]|nr:inositol monophosphatase [Rubritepida sp.]